MGRIQFSYSCRRTRYGIGNTRSTGNQLCDACKVVAVPHAGSSRSNETVDGGLFRNDRIDHSPRTIPNRERQRGCRCADHKRQATCTDRKINRLSRHRHRDNLHAGARAGESNIHRTGYFEAATRADSTSTSSTMAMISIVNWKAVVVVACTVTMSLACVV